MSISHRELTESEFANRVLGLPADHKPSTPDEIRASNRAIQLIQRATIAGDLKRIPGKDYFERSDAEQFAERIRNMPTGIERFFEPWHPPSQNECRWLLCCLDPGVARTKEELEEVWNDVCYAEEAVERAIIVGRLAFIAKAEASVGERVYKEARFIPSGELLRWAIESGSFQSFVSVAQGYGLRPAAPSTSEVFVQGRRTAMESTTVPSVQQEMSLVAPESQGKKHRRPPALEVKRRRKIVNELMKKPSDFGDVAKVAALFSKLDDSSIPLPSRKGASPRSGTYVDVKREIRKKVILTLQKDLQRQS